MYNTFMWVNNCPAKFRTIYGSRRLWTRAVIITFILKKKKNLQENKKALDPHDARENKKINNLNIIRNFRLIYVILSFFFVFAQILSNYFLRYQTNYPLYDHIFVFAGPIGIQMHSVCIYTVNKHKNMSETAISSFIQFKSSCCC